LVADPRTLLAHFHVSIMAKLLGACLSALASPCATKCHPKFYTTKHYQQGSTDASNKIRQSATFHPTSDFSHLSTNPKGVLHSIPNISKTYIAPYSIENHAQTTFLLIARIHIKKTSP
jgi:hypothetical protein